jgi:protein phosphatase
MVDPNEDTNVDFQMSFFAADEPTFNMDVAATSHIGKKRSSNEDHYAVFRRTRSCEMLMSNLPADDVALVDDNAYGILVADGIGGDSFGDFASRLAVETVLQAAGLATSWLMKLRDLEAQEVRTRVNAYVDRIQNTFRQHARANPVTEKMGTTLTAAYVLPPHAIVAHIGDSRAYLLRDNQLQQITKDQTMAQELIDKGADKESVKQFGHILINSLGSRRGEVDVQVLHLRIEVGDRLLVCTDGLSDLVDEQTIASVLSEFELNSVCDKLVDLALEQGGRDNITVVVGDLIKQPVTEGRGAKTKNFESVDH